MRGLCKKVALFVNEYVNLGCVHRNYFCCLTVATDYIQLKLIAASATRII